MRAFWSLFSFYCFYFCASLFLPIPLLVSHRTHQPLSTKATTPAIGFGTDVRKPATKPQSEVGPGQ